MDDLDVVPVLVRPDHRRWRRRAADHQPVAGRGLLRVVVEVAQQVVPDRRDAGSIGDFLGFHHCRERLGLEEPVRHYQRGAGEHGDVGEPPGVGVEERDDDEASVALTHAQGVRVGERVQVVAAV